MEIWHQTSGRSEVGHELDRDSLERECAGEMRTGNRGSFADFDSCP